LVDDPFASMRLGALRIFARLARTEAGAHLSSTFKRKDDGIAGRRFLDVDPAARAGMTRTPWTDKRLAYIAGLSVNRSRGLPDRKHDTAEGDQTHALQPFLRQI
jgi:hypothetical protein